MRYLRLLSSVAGLAAFFIMNASGQTQPMPMPASMPTSATGLLDSASPTTISIKPDSPGMPATFSCTKFTRFENDRGDAVAVANLKAGAAVTIYFGKDRNQDAAFRIVVHGG